MILQGNTAVRVSTDSPSRAGSVDAISIDSTGSRIALASQRFGQLVVWDWRAETFVLKQQGHDHAATCCAWSPGRAALYQRRGRSEGEGLERLQRILFRDVLGPPGAGHGRGVCEECSFLCFRDGTVRAYDLRRYRQFRVFKAPPPRAASNVSSTSEPGAPLKLVDVLQMPSSYVRRRRAYRCMCGPCGRGQLLDALAAHEGPVCALALDPRGGGGLASGSWDKTVGCGASTVMSSRRPWSTTPKFYRWRIGGTAAS